MDEAAGSGYTSVVLWLYRHLGICWTARTVRKGALGGHKHTIDCMRDQRALPLPVNKACLLGALIGGPDMRLARVIHDAGQPWSATAMAVAVALGKRRTVSRLCRAGCPHGQLAVVLAVVCGRRDLLDAMVATDDEIHRVVAILDQSHYCHHAHKRRYARIVCDAVTLGIRGRALAMAILGAYDTRALGIRPCRHHSHERLRSIDVVEPTIPFWGSSLWSARVSHSLTPHETVVHDLADKYRARDPNPFRNLAATLQDALLLGVDSVSPHRHGLDHHNAVQQPSTAGRAAKDMRDRESRARRRILPAATRSRKSPKDKRCMRKQ
jgi:hypothetical protein